MPIGLFAGDEIVRSIDGRWRGLRLGGRLGGRMALFSWSLPTWLYINDKELVRNARLQNNDKYERGGPRFHANYSLHPRDHTDTSTHFPQTIPVSVFIMH